MYTRKNLICKPLFEISTSINANCLKLFFVVYMEYFFQILIVEKELNLYLNQSLSFLDLIEIILCQAISASVTNFVEFFIQCMQEFS